MTITASDIDRAITAAFRANMGWCPKMDEPPANRVGPDHRIVPSPRKANIVKARRERVRQLFHSGMSNKEIARELDMLPSLVKQDISRLREKGRLPDERPRR